MIKLPRRPSTTYLRPAIADRWPYIIKWGQEFLRVLSASGNLASGDAHGNEFEEITIPSESQPWNCEIKLRRNRASEAYQRDYSGKYFRKSPFWALTKAIAFLPIVKFDLDSARLQSGVRSLDYT